MRKAKPPRFSDLSEDDVDIVARSDDPPHPAQAHIFAKRGDIEGLRLWLAAKGAVDVQDQDGNTPLLYACWERQLEVEKFLLDAGADVTHTNGKGRGVLHNLSNRFTRGDRRPAELALLLARGADPLAEDGEGRNAFDAEQDREYRNKEADAEHLTQMYVHLFNRMGSDTPSVSDLIPDTFGGREAIRIIQHTLAQHQHERLAQARAPRVVRKRA